MRHLFLTPASHYGGVFMRKTHQAVDTTQGVIWKQLLAFFFPLLLGTFFQQLYNTVDTVVVGRFVGTTALAAVGSTSVLSARSAPLKKAWSRPSE